MMYTNRPSLAADPLYMTRGTAGYHTSQPCHDTPQHGVQHSGQQHTVQGGHPTASPAPAEDGKCTMCCEYYGTPEYGGLCHGCFKNKTKETSSPGQKCRNCREYYGAEECGGLCNGCFLKQTERESHAGSQNQVPALPASSQPPPTCRSASCSF